VKWFSPVQDEKSSVTAVKVVINQLTA